MINNSENIQNIRDPKSKDNLDVADFYSSKREPTVITSIHTTPYIEASPRMKNLNVDASTLSEEEDEFFHELNENKVKKIKCPNFFQFKMKTSPYSLSEEKPKEEALVHTFASMIQAYKNNKVNTQPSDNPILRVFDDMMNDPQNADLAQFAIIRKKAIDFSRTHPASSELGDLLHRLGLKHMDENIDDKDGAIECLKEALKIYTFLDTKNLANEYNNNIKSAETLKRMADIYAEKREYGTAIECINESMKLYIDNCGKNSYEVAECILRHGNYLIPDEKWKEAKEDYNKALLLFINHFEKAKDKTIKPQKSSKNISVKELTEKDLPQEVQVANCYFKLGLIFEREGDLEKSLSNYKISYNIYTNCYKTELHEDVAITVYNIGLLHEFKNELEKSLTFFEKAYHIFAELSGKVNDDFIDASFRCGNILMRLKNLIDARKYFQEGIDLIFLRYKVKDTDAFIRIMEEEKKNNREFDVSQIFNAAKILSDDYLEIRDIVKGLKVLKLVIGLMPPEKEYINKANMLIEKYLEITLEQAKNGNKSTYADDYHEIIIYYIQKVETEAKTLITEALKEQNNGEASNDQLKKNIEINQTDQANGGSPEMKGETSLKKGKSKFLTLLPFSKVAETLFKFASFFTKLSYSRAAIELYTKAITFFEHAEKFENTKLETKIKNIEVLNYLGLEYDKLRDFESSIQYFEKIVDLRIKYQGENHIKTGGAYNNLAIAYERIEHYEKALICWNRCLNIRLLCFGKEHAKVANTYYNISYLHYNMKEIDKALECMLKAHAFYMKTNDEIFLAHCSIFIGELMKNKRLLPDAVKYTQQGYDILLKHPNKENQALFQKGCLVLGVLRGWLKQYDAALEVLKDPVEQVMSILAEEKPKNIILIIEAIYELGNSYEAVNNPELACKYFETTYDLAKDYWPELKLREVDYKIDKMKILTQKKR